MEKQRVVHEVSISSLLKVIAVIAILWLVYLLRDIVVLLLVVGVIVMAIEPFVHRLAKEGIPRPVSVIVLYLAILTLLGFFVYFIIPPVANQIKEMTLSLPYYTDRLSSFDFGALSSTLSSTLDGLTSRLSGFAGGIINAVISVFGGIVSTVTVFVLTYYFLVEEEGIRRSIVKLIPAESRPRFQETIDKMGEKLGRWLRGQISLMVIVGVVDGIALSILGIPFALTLGILSGLLEIIPVVGPIVAGVLAILVAFVSGVALWKILAIVLVYVLVQQLENNILVPKVMGRAVGLSPVVVIVAILVGAKLLGLGGAILAVPVAAGIQVFLGEYTDIGK
ncbi:MAG: AI-2E family transporter [Candidatus Berkelbacteria bacterium]|nr:AI-2E family transporter [Candidatus Berkelbacteria bacterium]